MLEIKAIFEWIFLLVNQIDEDTKNTLSFMIDKCLIPCPVWFSTVPMIQYCSASGKKNLQSRASWEYLLLTCFLFTLTYWGNLSYFHFINHWVVWKLENLGLTWLRFSIWTTFQICRLGLLYVSSTFDHRWADIPSHSMPGKWRLTVGG